MNLVHIHRANRIAKKMNILMEGYITATLQGCNYHIPYYIFVTNPAVFHFFTNETLPYIYSGNNQERISRLLKPISSIKPSVKDIGHVLCYPAENYAYPDLKDEQGILITNFYSPPDLSDEAISNIISGSFYPIHRKEMAIISTLDTPQSSLQFGFTLYIEGGEDYEVVCHAETIEDAERIFIARLDSGDYDDLIKDRDYTCGEVKALS